MKSLTSFLLVMLVVVSQLPARAADETNDQSNATTESSNLDNVALSELMTSFLHLQERVHATQLAVERSRADAEVAAAKSAQDLNERLMQIEDSVNTARSQDIKSFQESFTALKDSNRLMIQLAIVFAVAGFLALGMTAWLQWRTVSRLSEISTSAASHPIALPAPPWMNALGSGMPVAPNTQASAANARLMEALGRLEKRISEFEHHPVEDAPAQVHVTAEPDVRVADGANLGGEPESEPAESDGESDEFAGLLREGEDLLKSEKIQEAINCFDEILTQNPQHAEALLRKGTACERLQDNQEAIRCYDAAIAADSGLTMAYLYKGGLFNRMERFSEAMECYEKALRTQGNRRSA